VKLTLAAPAETVPLVAEAPICVLPSNTANVTVPEFTAPAPLLITALNVTDWLAVLKFAEAFPTLVVVEAAPTVN
jgi:hypothetical protein